MSNELIVLEKLEMVPFFTKGEHVDDLLTQIEKEALAFVPDTTTAKGRSAIKAMVTKVTKSKTYLEKHGKDLAAEYKAIPKVIDANRRAVKDKLTALAEQVREPLTAYEAEQEEIKRLELVEVDHEIGLLMNDKFNSDNLAALEAERKLEAERQAQLKAEQEAREKRIAEEAAASAKAEAEAAKQRAIEAEARAKVEAEQAEARRIEAEKQAKLNAERAAEQARLTEIARQEAEAKRIADEQAKREANKKHIGAVRKAAKESLIALGLDEETAKKVVLAINSGDIANVTINY